jgi:hypothetical protein
VNDSKLNVEPVEDELFLSNIENRRRYWSIPEFDQSLQELAFSLSFFLGLLVMKVDLVFTSFIRALRELLIGVIHDRVFLAQGTRFHSHFS